MKNATTSQVYFSIVGTMPFLDHWLDKNPIMHIGPPGFKTIIGVLVKRLVDRCQGNDKDFHDPEKPDFLDHFIEAKNADPENVDDAQIISWLMINMLAGADTTALTLKTAFYYCLRNKRILQQLRKEILAANPQEVTPVPYEIAHSSPYLEAVVREALRILPGISMSLERYVPQEGYRLSNGSFLPGGSTVGLNPYLISRNKEIYGGDVEDFRPERWLRDEAAGETQEQFEARLAAMNSVDLTFGGGRRICIGKNLGISQVYKVFATLVTSYEMELVDPNRDWKVVNSWFPRQEGGLDIKITRRRGHEL
ncbi:Pisatin demethylase [Diaporthe amygdali]|uniref:Pisatin demethylase n=1 Tax=Phomopsis amygdali TaxID=1214568 RepID=UPI0022FE68C6|nr:Pisatin demethylase [Diaporthe amygdali]KAJ0120345.1 Pisatin demethylase [Diaporthe amygdali]